MSDLKDRIKEVRKKNKLSQDQFGEKLGMTGASVSRYEAGNREISEAIIKHVAQTFRISEHWLRTGEGEMEEPEAADLVAALAREYNMDAGGVALLRAVARAFECLTPDQRDEILDSLFSDLQAAIEKKHTVDPAAHLVPDPQSPADSSAV